MPAATRLMEAAFSRIGKIGLAGFAGGGAVVGGVMGGLSDDGSVLGGAFKGAMVGAAAYGLGRRGLHGAMSYQGWRAGGVGVADALKAAVRSEARITKSFFGGKFTEAVNKVRSTLKVGTAAAVPVEKAAATAEAVVGDLIGPRQRFASNVRGLNSGKFSSRGDAWGVLNQTPALPISLNNPNTMSRLQAFRGQGRQGPTAYPRGLGRGRMKRFIKGYT